MSSSSELIVTKNGRVFDMSALVSNVKWSGRRGAAARSISVTLIDDDGYGHARPEIDVEDGVQCVFSWKGVELFRGMFMRQDQSKQKTTSLTAYDDGIRLSNNEDTFTYENKTASEIFIDVCKRFGIPYGEVADTKYRIPELIKPKTTGWDVICDALSLTYKAKGVRYYAICVEGKMRLLERRENLLQWVIETGQNLEDYTRTKSIEKVKTRIKALSKEDTVLAEATNAEVEKKLGIFQEITSVDDEMNSAQLNKMVKTMLAANSRPEQSLSVSTSGMPEVVSGVGVYIIIDHLVVSETFYVEDDSHEVNGNRQSMKLKLITAADIEEEFDDEPPVCTFVFKRILYYKSSMMRGDDVKHMQEELHKRGYDLGKPGIDGIFGKITDKAVRKFQGDVGLLTGKSGIDGHVGPKTVGKLGCVWGGK